MTIILSFDVGIANLAYCMVQRTEGEGNPYANNLPFEILQWEVIDLNAATLEEACRNLPRELHRRMGVLGVADRVVIERQTKSNVKMKVISHVIQSFFETHMLYQGGAMRVEFSSPHKKLGVYTGPAITCTLKNNYRRNKRLAIDHTQKILEKYPVFMSYFHMLSKKDDAADALLHALVCLNEERPPPPLPPPPREVDL